MRSGDPPPLIAFPRCVSLAAYPDIPHMSRRGTSPARQTITPRPRRNIDYQRLNNGLPTPRHRRPPVHRLGL